MPAADANPYASIVSGGQGSSLTTVRSAGEKSATAAETTATKRGLEVNVDAAVGQPYVVFEGTTLDTS